MIYTCKRCGRTDLFADEMRFTHVVKAWGCKKCYNKYAKEQRNLNPEKSRESVRKYKLSHPTKGRECTLMSNYGITLEEYDKLEKLQFSGCAICKQSCSSGDRLSVDHDYKTGKVRGLLCRRCNLLVANCNEDEDIIWNLLEYLKRTTWVETNFETITVKE